MVKPFLCSQMVGGCILNEESCLVKGRGLMIASKLFPGLSDGRLQLVILEACSDDGVKLLIELEIPSDGDR